MARAIFLPLALVAFLGLFAAGAHAAVAGPEDCPYQVGYGALGLASGDSVCAKNGNKDDSFALSGAKSVDSCAVILYNIIDVLAKNPDYQWADFMFLMSEEAFMMLNPAFKKLVFKPSLDIHAVAAQALSMVKVKAGEFVTMDVLLDTWGGPRVRFSSSWALDSVSSPGGRKLAAMAAWKMMSVSNIILF